MKLGKNTRLRVACNGKDVLFSYCSLYSGPQNEPLMSPQGVGRQRSQILYAYKYSAYTPQLEKLRLSSLDFVAELPLILQFYLTRIYDKELFMFCTATRLE